MFNLVETKVKEPIPNRYLSTVIGTLTHYTLRIPGTQLIFFYTFRFIIAHWTQWARFQMTIWNYKYGICYIYCMIFGANRFDHNLPTNKVRHKIIIILKLKKCNIVLSSLKSRLCFWSNWWQCHKSMSGKIEW